MATPNNTAFYGRISSKKNNFDVRSKSTVTKGFGYPTGKSMQGGYFNATRDVELVRNNLRQLLSTYKGERIMLPDYGLNLNRYLFEPLDQILFDEIREDIVLNISKYMGNIEILKLSIEGSESEYGRLNISLFCKIRESEDPSFEVSVELK
jgi:phage baseplate assembly protein W